MTNEQPANRIGLNGGEITPEMEAWIEKNRCDRPLTEAQMNQVVSAFQTVKLDGADRSTVTPGTTAGPA